MFDLHKVDYEANDKPKHKGVEAYSGSYKVRAKTVFNKVLKELYYEICSDYMYHPK